MPPQPYVSSCQTPARARRSSRSGPSTGPGCCTRSAGRWRYQRISIRSAHISTLAGQAIDTFYVTEADGSPPDDARSEAAVQALQMAAAGIVTRTLSG